MIHSINTKISIAEKKMQHFSEKNITLKCPFFFPPKKKAVFISNKKQKAKEENHR